MSEIYTNVARLLGFFADLFSAFPDTLKSIILYCFGAVLILCVLILLSKEGD